jgi:hypothetical protein
MASTAIHTTGTDIMAGQVGVGDIRDTALTQETGIMAVPDFTAERTFITRLGSAAAPDFMVETTSTVAEQ